MDGRLYGPGVDLVRCAAYCDLGPSGNVYEKRPVLDEPCLRVYFGQSVTVDIYFVVFYFKIFGGEMKIKRE